MIIATKVQIYPRYCVFRCKNVSIFLIKFTIAPSSNDQSNISFFIISKQEVLSES